MSKRADAFIEVGLLGGSLGTLKKNCSFTCQRRTYVPCLLKMGIIILGSYTTSESRPNCLQQQTTEESRRSNNFYSSTQVFVYFSIWKIQSDFFSFLYCLVLHNVLKNTQKVSFYNIQTKFRWMVFTIIRNDFFDYFRFFYDEVASISDFFEKTNFAMIN